MIQFPENLYTDIRIETVNKTTILLENFQLKQKKTKEEKGAMIRIYDGTRWYYSATTNIDGLQEEVDKLSKMAKPNPSIYDDPVVRKFEVNRETLLKYSDSNVSDISIDEKQKLLDTYVPAVKSFPQIKTSEIYYIDRYTEKHFFSSKGADVRFDAQYCCIAVRYSMQENEIPYNGRWDAYKMNFRDLQNLQEELKSEINRDLQYCRHAVAVKPGIYTCVLAPVVTGVFAHESFGHKSESDFMIGDETMKREWTIGKSVGSPALNIVDTGLVPGAGYVPFDDEGTKARKNYIIRNGLLTGRLHSCNTAMHLNEELTGNARAVSFEYEPIVRMTTTYIEAGNQTKEELIGSIDEGIYIENLKHGSGMTTFTIAPTRAYMIRNGKIAEPVRISVITGNVMKTLHEIDGFSDKVELFSFPLGGCGKMEQFPLSVGFGGPYIRVKGINVQ